MFQRTAQWVMPAMNPAYTPEEQAAFRQDPHLMEELRAGVSQLFDGFSDAIVDAESPQMKMIEEACLANLDDNVIDPELRERLRPDYRAACKRLIVSGDFYQASRSPTPSWSPTRSTVSRPVGSARPTAACTNSMSWSSPPASRSTPSCDPCRSWAANGRPRSGWAHRPEAYLSISVPGFPNFFMLNGPNGPVGNFSLVEVAELQIGYIMQLVDRLRAGDCREISATQAAMDAIRGGTGGGRQEDGLGDGVSQLVPRRPRRSRRLALALRALPGRDGRARVGTPTSSAADEFARPGTNQHQPIHASALGLSRGPLSGSSSMLRRLILWRRTSSASTRCCSHRLIEIGRRRAWITGITAHPNATWLAQQARNVVGDIADEGIDVTFFVRDPANVGLTTDELLERLFGKVRV